MATVRRPAAGPMALVNRRAPVDLSRPIVKAIDDAVTAFEREVGGRAALIATLAVTETTAEIDRVVQLLADPSSDQLSLAAICQEARLTPSDLLRAYKHATIAKAQILGLQKASAAAPAILDDLTARSVTHETPCYDCRRTGKVLRERRGKDGDYQAVQENCPVCAGLGTQLKPADPVAQERILDMTGLLPKAGPGIAIQNNTHLHTGASAAGGSTGGALERLQDAVSTILARTPPQPPAAPPPDSVEAELVQSPET